ncbi:penicillin-binding protein [Alteribacillus sp. HJP-4]|uniref:penicillin-binding protein n=1 Tax=Alteribacillus sp. HJP-4 TaxID=2775394 RepID=UPI0035CD0FBA
MYPTHWFRRDKHGRYFPVLPFLAGIAVSPFLFGGYGCGGYDCQNYGPDYGPDYGPHYGPSYGPNFGPNYGPQYGPHGMPGYYPPHGGGPYSHDGNFGEYE